jgi:psp operon transcriptional activator
VLDPFPASPGRVADVAPSLPPVRVSGPTDAASVLEPAGDFEARTRAYEARLLRDAMEASRFNQRIAARTLGLTYYQLRHHLKVHGLLAKPGQPPAEASTVTGVET